MRSSTRVDKLKVYPKKKKNTAFLAVSDNYRYPKSPITVKDTSGLITVRLRGDRRKHLCFPSLPPEEIPRCVSHILTQCLSSSLSYLTCLSFLSFDPSLSVSKECSDLPSFL